MKYFRSSWLLTALFLSIAFIYGSNIFSSTGFSFGSALQALLATAVLAIMEVSLSFDNAVVNASILKNWNAFWRKMFLYVGIFVSVIGMRCLFPILIVAVAKHLPLLEVAHMTLTDPQQYSQYLGDTHTQVMAFGGTFLMMVFFSYFIDHEKEIHWLHMLEKPLSKLGGIKYVGRLVSYVFVSLLFYAIVSLLVPAEETSKALIAGGIGIALYLAVQLFCNVFGGNGASKAGGSIGGFIYINLLDASFSFDGVIGAFAFSDKIVLIMLGLGIGAWWVRSMTVYLVEKGALAEYIYLEHGAHWAIGALALIMLIGTATHIPEVFTALFGISLIAGAFYSSLQHNKAQ